MKLYCKKRGKFNQTAETYDFLEYLFYLNYNEKMPKIKKTPNGKPYFPDRSDIHFSLSHSKTHILCALSPTPVGVDIESERTINERTMNFFCSPEELLDFEPLELWVLKESYIKLFGKTLVEIRNLHFSRDGCKIITPDDSVISHLYRTNTYYAAVSTTGHNPRLCGGTPFVREEGMEKSLFCLNRRLSHPPSIELIK